MKIKKARKNLIRGIFTKLGKGVGEKAESSAILNLSAAAECQQAYKRNPPSVLEVRRIKYIISSLCNERCDIFVCRTVPRKETLLI